MLNSKLVQKIKDRGEKLGLTKDSVSSVVTAVKEAIYGKDPEKTTFEDGSPEMAQFLKQKLEDAINAGDKEEINRWIDEIFKKAPCGESVSDAFSPEARKAAIEARRRKMKGKLQGSVGAKRDDSEIVGSKQSESHAFSSKGVPEELSHDNRVKTQVNLLNKTGMKIGESKRFGNGLSTSTSFVHPELGRGVVVSHVSPYNKNEVKHYVWFPNSKGTFGRGSIGSSDSKADSLEQAMKSAVLHAEHLMDSGYWKPKKA